VVEYLGAGGVDDCTQSDSPKPYSPNMINHS
jgi:hypothetical protein